jgi:very-short-patch-repair endonuclease
MSTIRELLENARNNLLDLGLRNKLINFKLDGQRVVRAYDELPEQIFDFLVIQKKSMKFAPIKESKPDQLEFALEDTESNLDQPEESSVEESDDSRHHDSIIQTKLNGKNLQNKLLRIETEARIAIEERGANILYLALGFLKWYESDSSDESHFAPLVLIPVKLSRESANSRFKLVWSEEDIVTNESLLVKMKTDFGINLPRLPDEIEELDIIEYFTDVETAIEGHLRWEVISEIALGFFTFAKLLMWRDLDVEKWPKENNIEDNPLISSILNSSPLSEPSPYSDDDFIDNKISPKDLSLITDADSSQTLAVLDAYEGRSLTVQGPPGTGKSQTITNIIASSLSQGKTVLFLAEKMAALEVVKKRLDLAGLGDACLELHSFKLKKSTVIERISNTLESSKPIRGNQPESAERLKILRDNLNEYAIAMNMPLIDGGITPHGAIGIIEKYRGYFSHLDGIGITELADITIAQFEERREHVKLLEKYLAIVGNPLNHPWRGVQVDALLPSDKNKIVSDTNTLHTSLISLNSVFKTICGELELELATTLANTEKIEKIYELIVNRPPFDYKGSTNQIWENRKDELLELVEYGIKKEYIKKELLNDVRPEVLSMDYEDTLKAYRTRSDSKLKFLYKDYRQAKRTLKIVCLPNKFPKTTAKAITLLEQLCEYRKIIKNIVYKNKIGRDAFTERWNGIESDWLLLKHICDWMNSLFNIIAYPKAALALIIRIEKINNALLNKHYSDIRMANKECRVCVAEWAAITDYDFIESFGMKAEEILIENLITKLKQGLERDEAIYEWISYRRERDKCSQIGIGAIATRADNNEISSKNLVPQYEYAYGNAVIEKAMRERKCLREFDGDSHSQLIDKFKNLDRKLIEITRQYLAAMIWEGMPHPTIGNPQSSSMNYLTNQLRRKRGIAPVRELMQKVGDVIEKIKPCFMMSPMSVAQFLPPGKVNFDLLVIDEASQMRPADALGALARCKQCIIVGDKNQLPPTNFFDKMLEEDNDIDLNLGDVESILDAAKGTGKGRTLRWHYRSRHESLIAFSNKEFYDDKLHVFPSPDHESVDFGIIGHYIENGVYGRGGSRKNINEAAAVVASIIKHAQINPGQSLGVVALSRAQQEAIQDKLEEVRRYHPELEGFFLEDKEESFFIKNLETVQGDEREVIFISIGYGKDEFGFPHMNFGPINREGGWKRLNVLITRARSRCEVFHSLRSEEIKIEDLSEAERQSAKGRITLRNYLAYVETGQLEQPNLNHKGESESLFEESVAAELEKHGFTVHKQVGVAKFRIDMAIINPDKPGKYLLGVECDGASYHSAKSARDRDRLRQEVLEGLGWKIYRIWSLDWIKDPEKDIRKLLLEIEKLRENIPKEDQKEDNRQDSKKGGKTEIIREEVTKEAKSSHELINALPYRKAFIPWHKPWNPESPPMNTISDLVVYFVQQESPIHKDEVIKRIASSFNFGRVGNRIGKAVSDGIRRAKNQKKIDVRKSFLWDPGMMIPPIRNRSGTGMGIETVTPEEIQLMAKKLNDISFGMKDDYLIREIARCLGYERVSFQIEGYISKCLKNIIA